jgi:hypothetical protein
MRGKKADMRRVLMLTPHFPPDSSAASHRVRLLAPYMRDSGWDPTIVTIDPRDYEGGVEPALNALVPDSLSVVRCRAWAASSTRRFGFGDLGLRSMVNLRSACSTLLATRRFDALFITIYPVYPALLGPGLKRRFGVKFVLDYQDPWVGTWGLTVGAGPKGSPDLRSRLTRHAGQLLEPIAVRAADAITAVSQICRTATRVACSIRPMALHISSISERFSRTAFRRFADFWRQRRVFVFTIPPRTDAHGCGLLEAAISSAPTRHTGSRQSHRSSACRTSFASCPHAFRT